MTGVVSAAAEIFERERKEFEARTPRSRERFRRALDVFPGGDTRSATNYEPYPATIGRAEGIELVDLDGNQYADFLLNYTSLITGHERRAPTVHELGRRVDAALNLGGTRLHGAADRDQGDRRLPRLRP